jgi:hypothetical protein
LTVGSWEGPVEVPRLEKRAPPLRNNIAVREMKYRPCATPKGETISWRRLPERMMLKPSRSDNAGVYIWIIKYFHPQHYSRVPGSNVAAARAGKAALSLLVNVRTSHSAAPPISIPHKQKR